MNNSEGRKRSIKVKLKRVGRSVPFPDQSSDEVISQESCKHDCGRSWEKRNTCGCLRVVNKRDYPNCKFCLEQDEVISQMAQDNVRLEKENAQLKIQWVNAEDSNMKLVEKIIVYRKLVKELEKETKELRAEAANWKLSAKGYSDDAVRLQQEYISLESKLKKAVECALHTSRLWLTR